MRAAMCLSRKVNQFTSKGIISYASSSLVARGKQNAPANISTGAFCETFFIWPGILRRRWLLRMKMLVAFSIDIVLLPMQRRIRLNNHALLADRFQFFDQRAFARLQRFRNFRMHA